MSMSRIEDALSQLDSTEQALLDLSLHRGFDDQLLASLVEGDASDVEAMRDATLDKLARLAKLDGDDARERVLAELRSLSDSTWVDPNTPPPRERRRASFAVAALIATAVAVAAIILLAGGGDGGGDKGVTAAPTSTTSAAAKPAKPAKPATLQLQPLDPNAQDHTSVSVSGSGDAQRLTLKLSGLPSPRGGAYELWLYDSLLRSRPLGSLTAGQGSISARIPAGASAYRWLDLSLQPGSDRVHHSGQSVFRAPLSRILSQG